MKRKIIIASAIVAIVGAGAFILMKPNHSAEVNTNIQPVTVPTQPTHTQVAVVTKSKPTGVDSEISTIEANAKNLNTNVLKLSLVAYQHAVQKGVTTSPLLTIIDFSKPDTQRRLWVVNVDTGKVLFNTLVAHGKNSGSGNVADSFSNQPSSLKSSLGVFVTGSTYYGKHGRELHIHGLEPGVNSNAYDRSVVIHGANYVSESLAKNDHRIGHSWGCPAVSMRIVQPLINAIKNQSLIFAYYPDQHWLSHSSFLSN